MPLVVHPNAQRRVLAQAEGIAGQTSDRLASTIDEMSQQGVDPSVVDEVIREAGAIERASPADLAPNETFDAEREVTVGRRAVLLRHVGAGHTEGRTRNEVQALTPQALSDISGSPARNLGVVYDEVAGA